MPRSASDWKKRFWSHVKIGNPDECWNWTFGLNNYGYGQMSLPKESGYGSPILSNRAAYIATYGNIPRGMCVLHKCDNRRCCNPHHLFLGTRADNLQDMRNKNRHSHGKKRSALQRLWTPRGENSVHAKLTEKQAISILKEYNGKKGEPTMFARRYNVSQSTIDDLLHRRSWTHLQIKSVPARKRH